MTDHRARLSAEIRARRLALGMHVAGAARAAGIDRSTWIKAETGDREIAAHTAARIERVLRWTPGSIDAILNSGEPTEVEPATPEPHPAPRHPSLQLTDEEQARLTAELARIESMQLPASAKLQMTEALIRAWAQYAAERATRRRDDTA